MAADKVVRVELQGGTEQFQKSFKDAASSSQALAKSMKEIEGQISGSFKDLAASLGPVGKVLGSLGPEGLGAAAGIGAVATAMGGLVAFTAQSVKGLADLGGHLSDLSARTGLSTTTLQELRFAGALVGVSLEEAAGAVGKMQKAITAGDSVFERLGLNLDALRKLKVADQFEQVAAAIKAIADPTQQAAAAMEAFGKGGAAILPLVKSDTAAAREEFERLGLSIGEGTIAAADKLGDEFDKLGLAFEGVKNQLAAGIVESGALTAVTETLKETLGALASLLNENKDLIRGFFVLGLAAAKELASYIPTIKTALAGVVQLLAAANPLIAKALGDTAADLKFLLDSAAQFQAMQERIAAATKGAGGVGGPAVEKKFVSQQDIEKAAKLAEEMDKIAAAEKKAAIEANKRAAAEDAAVEKVNAAVKKRQSGAKESIFGTSPESAKKAVLAFNDIAKALGVTVENAGEGIVSFEGLGEAIGNLGQNELTALEAQLDKLEKQSREDPMLNGVIAKYLGQTRAALRELGDGFEKGTQQIAKAKSTTQDWANALDQVSDAFSQLGGAGGELGSLVGQLSKVLKISQGIGKAIQDAGGFSKLNTAGKFQVGGAVAGAAIGIGVDAFNGASTSAGKSVAKGALGGAAKGALIGSVVPGIGTAVGAVVGGVIGGVAGFLGSKKKTKELLKGFDDNLIQQFGSIKEAERIAKQYGIALDKTLDSKKPEKITKAINELNAALTKRANLEQGLATAQQNVESLQDLTKEINNPKLSAAVQALASKVSDELLEAGLGFAATGPLRDSEAFTADQNISRATAGTVGGLRQAGVVDQGVIDAAGQVAGEVQKKAFEDAKAAGLDDRAAQKASFGAVSDLLREQLNASLASGRDLDANTKELVAEAKANGIDILADPAVEAVAVQKQILGAIQDQGGVGGTGGGDSNVIDARDRFKSAAGFAGGSGGFRNFGSGTPAVLHGLEAVVRPSDLAAGMPRLASGLAAGSAALSGGSSRGGDVNNGPVSISPTIIIQGSGLSQAQPAQAVGDAMVRVMDGGSHPVNARLDRKYGR